MPAISQSTHRLSTEIRFYLLQNMSLLRHLSKSISTDEAQAIQQKQSTEDQVALVLNGKKNIQKDNPK